MFLGSLTGFHAVLKAKPNHFLVDEQTTFETQESLQLLEKTSTKVEGQNLKRRAGLISDVCSKSRRVDATETTNDIHFVCDFAWCKMFLQEKLSEGVYVNLREFANIKINDSQEGSEIESLNIGTFLSKLDRLLLHRSVCYLFPQLRTITTPHSNTITVEANKTFQEFQKLIGLEKTKTFLRFVLVERPEKHSDGVTIEGEYSKEIRRQLHHLIGNQFGKFVETKTCPGNSSGAQRIIVRTKVKRAREIKLGTCDKVTAFTLWKKNTETHNAIQQLSAHLQLRPHMFKFAGIKDKRAITTQCCTVSGITPERFEDECQYLPDHIRISNVRPATRAIRMGELAGNHFTIRLTNVHRLIQDKREMSIRQIVENALEELKRTGFINFFGQQRFGRKITSLGAGQQYQPIEEAPVIGLAMLQGNFKRAVDIFLTPTETLHSSSKINGAEEAKAYFQSTGDIDGALKRMPLQKMREISILRTLRRYGTSGTHAYIKALMGLSHSARLLYLHSFCSWVWNEIGAERIRRYGRKVVSGDLALKEPLGNFNDESELGRNDKIFIVSEDDILQERVKLEDIVLTVPGNQVIYPPNLKEEYMKYLNFSTSKDDASDNSTMEPQFRIPELKLNAPGAYRKLIEFPISLTYRFLGFHKSAIAESEDTNRKLNPGNITRAQDSAAETKSLNDQEKTANQVEKNNVVNRCSMTPPSMTENDDQNVVNGAEKTHDSQQRNTECTHIVNPLPVCDVEIKFGLPPSCYATTCINELTKGNVNG